MKQIAFAARTMFMALLFPLCVQAQTGATFHNAFDAGVYGIGTYQFSDTRNTVGFGNEYAAGSTNGQAGEDIYYQFTIQGSGQVNVSHCGSGLSDTYLHLLNSDGTYRQGNNDWGPLCSGYQASLSAWLPAGTYYIVSEGNGSNNGNITTTIQVNVQSSAVGSSLNYIRTFVARKPFTEATDLIASSRTAEEITQVTDYADGFGRLVQTVSRKTNPQQNDAVQLYAYDNWGREVKKYMPFIATTNDGNFKENGLQQLTAFGQSMYPGEQYFYSQVDYEQSPISRELKHYPQGNSWVGVARGSSVQYLVNTAADQVQVWNISLEAGSLPVSGGAYAAGQLYKIISVDEKGLQTIDFTDKDGRSILKKVQLTAAADAGSGSGHAGWLCTYHVYDNYGNHRFVITPRVVQLIDGSWSISQPVADELCFRFEYNLKGKPVIKKSPGAQEQWFVYDQRGRLVMSQDGNQRSHQKWQYFQFDSQDRPVSTGLITDPANFNNRAFHESAAAGSTQYPNTGSYAAELLQQTYYDNYNWVAGTGLSAAMDQSQTSNTSYFLTPDNNSHPYPQPIRQTAMVRGLKTGTQTAVLNSNSAQYIYNVQFYDDNGHVVQSQTTNLSGAVDKVTMQYSWTGIPIRVLEQHAKGGQNSQWHNVLTKMNYDAGNRLLSITKSIAGNIGGVAVNSGDRVLATYSYDELGRMKTKNLGYLPNTATALETVAYDYNIRGWLAGVNKAYLNGSNSNYFGQELAYDQTTSVTGTTSYLNPAFDGSLGGQIWKSRGDARPRKYDYSYDNASRLTRADFSQNTGSNVWDKSYIDYTVNNISYDANGNIQNLNQNGFILGGPPQLDDLHYTYHNGNVSNRLMHVTDNANNAQSRLGDFHYPGTKTASSVDFNYDANGNLVSDANKSIGVISYNTLNLPLSITVNGKGTISFVYDAAGNKLKKLTQEYNASVPYNGTVYTSDITTTTLYIGGFIYQSKSYSNPALASLQYPETLQLMAHEEGRARLVTAPGGQPAFAFDYFLRDHLGNIRVTLTDETQQDTYPAATLEAGAVGTEQAYYHIINDAAHVVPVSSLPWYPAASGSSYQNNNGLPSPPDPTINRFGTSANLYRLNGATGDRFGMGIALKVMAGDVISVFGKSVWHNNGQTTNNSSYLISQVLQSFIQSITGTAAVTVGSKGTATGTSLSGNPATTTNLSSLLNGVPTPAGQTPRAYINWILFDEQFKPVANGSGFDPVHVSADVVKSHARTGISIGTSGYLYIYCSNESNQDVYFDNLQVVHTRGPLLEERHFYPQGLLMAGISSRAFGKLQNNFGYQGKELEYAEFADGSGLEQYDFEARYYDPQLARWTSQDPAAQFASPYGSMANNWPSYTDPDGRVVWFVPILVGAAIGAVTSAAVYTVMAGDQFNWRDFGRAAAFGAVGGAISGGLSAIGTSLGTFGQSLAYNVMSSTAGTIGTNLVFGNELTWGTIASAVVSGFIAGDFGNFSGVEGGAFKNAIAEVGFNAAKGGLSGTFGGAVGALVDGTDLGTGIMNGARNGAIGGAVSSGLMIVTFGAAIKPNETVLNKIEKINAHFGISDTYAPVFRRGGLYQFFTETFTRSHYSRGVAWGRNLVVPYNDETDTYVHEYMHFVQQVQQGWGTMQGKGIWEQIRMTFSGGKYDPYKTPGTNEFEADKWTKFFMSGK